MTERRMISIPADPEGFVSRKCPTCSKLFKIKLGEGSDKPLSHCPYCNAQGDDWFTDEQRAYVKASSVNFAQEVVGKKLEEMARGFNRRMPQGGLISMKMTHQSSPKRPPPPKPVESEEPMPVAAFDCCDERVKHDGSTKVLHCIICGSPANS